MPRPEKVQAVAEIKERMEEAAAVFVTEFRGLSVKQMQALRRSLRESGAEYKVVKMTLARRAADDLGIERLLLGADQIERAGDLRAGLDQRHLRRPGRRRVRPPSEGPVW